MNAPSRRIPMWLLIVAALVGAASTTWASHIFIRRDLSVSELPPNVYYGLVWLNDLVVPPIPSSSAVEDFRPAAYPSPAAQAYFRRLMLRAQPYYQPPTELIDLWTQATGGSCYRRGWPLPTYQSVSTGSYGQTPSRYREILTLWWQIRSCEISLNQDSIR